MTLPVEFTKAPSELDAKLFLSWTDPVKTAYLSDKTLPLTIGLSAPAGSPQITVTAAGPPAVIVFAVPSVAPAVLTSAVFLSWHQGHQLAYLNAHGTGAPKSLVLRNATVPQYVASIDAAGNGTTIHPLPPNFTTAPSLLKVADFLAWNWAVQAAYIDINGTGSPKSVNVGLSGPPGPEPKLKAEAAVPQPLLTFLPEPIALASLTTAVFSSWSIGHQLAYVNANGSGTPKFAIFGPAAGTQFLAVVNGAAGDTGVDVSALPADFGKAPSALEAGTFLRWRSDQQLVYTNVNGGGIPKTVIIGASGAPMVAAAIRPDGKSLTFTYAAPTTAPGSLTVSEFQSWPPGVQLHYIDTKTLGTAEVPLLIGTTEPKLLAWATGTPKEAVMGYPPADFAKAPTDLDLSTFMRWSPRVQYAYAFAKGAVVGAGANITVGRGGASEPAITYVATLNVLGLAEAILAPPTIPPANVAPTAFLSWPESIRRAYVAAKGSGVPPTLTIGPFGVEPALSVKLDPIFTLNYVTDYWKDVVAATPAPVIIDATRIAPANFWSTQGDTPTDPVIDTSTLTSAIPYHYLVGSPVGLTSAINEVTAEGKFPTYDGINKKLPGLPEPADKISNKYTAQEFLQLHSAHQLEILKGTSTFVTRRSTVTLDDGSTRKVIEVGTGDTITVVEGGNADELFIVHQLQKRSFATMSMGDQEAVGETAAFAALGATFGLSTDRGAMIALADAALDEIKVEFRFL